MPSEKRLITFRDHEVREAVLLFIAGKQSEVREEITDIRLGSGTTATLKYARRPDIEVQEDALCTALLMYCNAKRVPLPERGVKSLRREDAGLTLVITLADAPFATQLRPNAAS